MSFILPWSISFNPHYQTNQELAIILLPPTLPFSPNKNFRLHFHLVIRILYWKHFLITIYYISLPCGHYFIFLWLWLMKVEGMQSTIWSKQLLHIYQNTVSTKTTPSYLMFHQNGAILHVGVSLNYILNFFCLKNDITNCNNHNT